MLGYVDGTMVPPPCFEPETSSTLNTKYLAWKAVDQRLLCLLLSSLTEEAILILVGLSTVRDVWLALVTTFNHHLKARELRQKNDLQLGNYVQPSFKSSWTETQGWLAADETRHQNVAEYAHTFKIICDQLHAIGRPVEDIDKMYWFLCELGTNFSTFSTAQLVLTPLPYFTDLVSKAESFELFQRSP